MPDRRTQNLIAHLDRAARHVPDRIRQAKPSNAVVGVLQSHGASDIHTPGPLPLIGINAPAQFQNFIPAVFLSFGFFQFSQRLCVFSEFVRAASGCEMICFFSFQFMPRESNRPETLSSLYAGYSESLQIFVKWPQIPT